MPYQIFNHSGIGTTVGSETNGRTCKLHKLRTLHLFSGAGGGILGDLLLGHQPVCAVEIEPYCQQVLHARQQDGILPWFPIFADVKEFEGKPWRGIADIVCGGFPCQDISTANRQLGEPDGLEGERSGLWAEMRRIVGEVRPRYVFVENSPVLALRGLDRILGDLAEMGYDARWGVFSAADVGARHQRERVWIVAHSDEIRLGIPAQYRAEQHPELLGEDARFRESEEWNFVGDCAAGADDNLESVLLRKSDVLANQVDRVAAIGNGQVPAVAAMAWKILSAQLRRSNGLHERPGATTQRDTNAK